MKVPVRREQTVMEVLRRSVAAHGDRPFLVEDGRTITYADIDHSSNRLAHGLAALGIGRGDTVLMMLPNRSAVIDLWLALAKLGAIEVPVNLTDKQKKLLREFEKESDQRTYSPETQGFFDRIKEFLESLKV